MLYSERSLTSGKGLMIEIAQDRNVVTVINAFREPRNHGCPLDAWVRATELRPGVPPGIIFAALHRSQDGTRVVLEETGRHGR